MTRPDPPTSTGLRSSLEEAVEGLETSKFAITDELESMVLTTDTDTGFRIRHDFRDGWVTWRYLGLRVGSETRGINPYEAFKIDDQLYLVQFQRDDRPIEAASLVIDLRYGRTVAVVTTLGGADSEGLPVAQRVLVSELENHAVAGEPIVRSAALAEAQFRWRTESGIGFDHSFAGEDELKWAWVSESSRTIDRHLARTWQIRTDVHLVAARDRENMVASIYVASRKEDHCQAHGVVFGLETGETSVIHTTFSVRDLRPS